MRFTIQQSFIDALGGDVALTTVRLAIAVASGWIVYTMAKMLRRATSHRKIAVIPRSILWFTMFWSVVSLTVSVVLMVTDYEAVTGVLRTFYGVTLAWQLVGVAWVLAVGSSGSLSALEAMEKISSIVEGNGGDEG